MKNYLAVFTGSARATAAWQQLDENERQIRSQRGMRAWQDWAQQHAEHIIEIGGPLSQTTLVNSEGISETHNALAAFTVVKAQSKQAAAQYFLGHPHFTEFLGEAVEIMEILPIPSA